MEEIFDVLDKFGQLTEKTAPRQICHKEGLWHRGVVVFIIDPKHQRTILQQRSLAKDMWPGLWDVAAGGHVLAGELGYQAALRELKEELGIAAEPHDLLYISCNLSQNIFPGRNDFHINEYFVLERDLDPKKLTLQTEEVAQAAWVKIPDLREKLQRPKNDLVKKHGCFETLLRYIDAVDK